MAKIIDAEKLMEKFSDYEWAGDDTARSMLANAIERTPAAVVRCKDCIHSLPNDGKLVETARYCTLFCSGTLGDLAAVWDGDFCSSGELKDQLIVDVLKKDAVHD